MTFTARHDSPTEATRSRRSGWRLMRRPFALAALTAAATLLTACDARGPDGAAGGTAATTGTEDARAGRTADSAASPSDTEARATGATADGAAATVQGPLFAIFTSATGSFRVRLEHEAAPRLCANFINLAKRGFYTRQQWIDFSPVVRQTGACKPGREPAYSLPREFSPKLLFDEGGRLCASNTTDDDATARAKPTRIFVTIKPQDRWNLKYAVFGTIVEGLEVARTLTEGELIAEVAIEGDPAPLLARYARQIAEWNAALDAVDARNMAEGAAR
jgi:cyclophilin family peptidyl-prolyl cis-trans isomerase